MNIVRDIQGRTILNISIEPTYLVKRKETRCLPS